MQNLLTLDLGDAQKLVDAACRASERIKVNQNIAVVDRAGELLLFLRMDGAKAISAQMAINKAFTAAGTRSRTDAITDRTLPGEPGWMIQTQHGGRFTTLGGGVPVQLDGQTVGAIGVSGGSVAEDMEIADCAVTAFLNHR
jgi:uncharacterized protein GlcG (DUF336 family)